MRKPLRELFLLTCALGALAGCGTEEPPPASEQNPFGQPAQRSSTATSIPVAANPHPVKASAEPIAAKPVSPTPEVPPKPPEVATVKRKRSKQAPETPSGESPQATIIHIERLGGKVKFDQKDPLHPVVAIDFSGTNLKDAGLRKIAGLATLRTLNLNHTKITGAGLAALSSLTNLRVLYLDGTKIKNADLKHLENMSSLQELYLYGTKVNPAGVNALKKTLPKLKVSH